MPFETLRDEIQQFLNFQTHEKRVEYVVHETTNELAYTRHLISYMANEGDKIPAYLLIPDGEGRFPAILIQHQHNGQRHWEKSEVCGLVGDPFQAFAPILASKGLPNN